MEAWEGWEAFGQEGYERESNEKDMARKGWTLGAKSVRRKEGARRARLRFACGVCLLPADDFHLRDAFGDLGEFVDALGEALLERLVVLAALLAASHACPRQ